MPSETSSPRKSAPHATPKTGIRYVTVSAPLRFVADGPQVDGEPAAADQQAHVGRGERPDLRSYYTGEKEGRAPDRRERDQPAPVAGGHPVRFFLSSASSSFFLLRPQA
jgi:hypothetical protein